MSRQMKDSGIEWVKLIPTDWNVEKGKHILSLLNRPVLDTDDVITCFRDGEVTLRTNRRTEGFTLSLQETGYQGIEEGDLVVHGMDGFAGAIGISDSRGKATPVLNVLDSTQDKRYLKYYLRSMATDGVFLSLSTGIRVRSCDTNWNKLKELPYPVPPKCEQSYIAAFLDRQCAHIDTVIEKTKASIEEYKKLKQAVITQAVTKGVRGDRPMKDSGIEWIGEIPVEWRVQKIKHSFNIISGTTPDSGNPAYYDGEIIWITPADYKTEDKYINGGRRNLTREGYESCGTTLVPRGSIIFSKRAPIGSVAIAEVELCTNQGCLCCINKSDENEDYYYYSMSAFTEVFNLLGSGTTFKEISLTTFCNFQLPHPNRTEQDEIAAYLNEKCRCIDEIIAKKERVVCEQESYKKSLIYEYVTGKKEVPVS